MISDTFVRLYEQIEKNSLEKLNSNSQCSYGIIIEYCEGGSLQSNPPMITDEAELLFHYKYLCKALKVSHKYDIAHRDLSCFNIFRKNGRFKIGDFGCSKIVDLTNSAITNTGCHFYYSPLVFLKRIYNRSISNPLLNDVWSLGVLFIEIPLSQFKSNLFVREDKIVSQIEINNIIDNKLNNYSVAFRDLIKGMLKYEESERFSAKKAYRKIQKMT